MSGPRNNHESIENSQIHPPKDFEPANGGDTLRKNLNKELTWDSNPWKIKITDLVDINAAPPTEVSGDRFIVIEVASTVADPGWDSAVVDDIVEFSSITGVWGRYTPTQGDMVYANDPDDMYYYNGNEWLVLVAGGGGGGSVSIKWRFSTNTADANPGNGNFRLDNATQGSAGTIFLSDISNTGVDVTAFLDSIKVGTDIFIQQEDDSTRYHIGTVDADTTDATTYWKVPIAFSDSGVDLVNNKTCLFIFQNDLDTLYSADGTIDEDRIVTVTTTNQLSIQNNFPVNTAVLIIDQLGGGDSGIEIKVAAQSYVIGIDNSDGDKLEIGTGTSIGSNSMLEFGTGGNAQFLFDVDIEGALTVNAGDTSTTPQLQIIQSSTGDAGLSVGVTGQSYYFAIDNSDADKLKIGEGTVIGTTPLMTIDTTGKVGIGTDSPATLLEIESVDDTVVQINPTVSGKDATIFLCPVNRKYWISAQDDGADALLQIGSGSTAGAAVIVTIKALTASVGINQVSPDERLHVVGNVKVEGQAYEDIQATLIPAGTTQTIDWDDGNFAVVDLADASGNVTLTLSNPNAGAFYFIKVIQDATTPRDLVWPAAVLWPGGTAPVISTGATDIDTISMGYDGANYLATFAQDFS